MLSLLVFGSHASSKSTEIREIFVVVRVSTSITCAVKSNKSWI